MFWSGKKNNNDSENDGVKKSSDPLWNNFRETELDWCCKVIAELKMLELPCITICTADKDVVTMRMKYCPRCGREIDQYV